MIEDIKIEEIDKNGTRKQVNVDAAASGYHNYLIAFNALIDLDYAILRMIRAEYNNPKYINQTVMNFNTKQIKTVLLNRDNPNPVSVCIRNKKISEDIYREIMDKRYSDLLSYDKYMDVTGIFFFVSVLSNVENIHINVLCASQQEADVIKHYHSKVYTIVMDDPSDLDVDKYTDFIFKNATDVLKFKKPFIEKRISFLNYRFNVDIDDDGPYPNLKISHYLFNTGFSRTALMDTYRNDDPDYAALIILRKPNKKKK